MLERPKISPSQQPRSLGISPSDLASKSLGVKIENGQVTLGEKNSSDLDFKIGDRKRAQTNAIVDAALATCIVKTSAAMVLHAG